MLTFLITDIPLYDLLDQNVKIPDEPFWSHILHKDSVSINGKIEKKNFNLCATKLRDWLLS